MADGRDGWVALQSPSHRCRAAQEQLDGGRGVERRDRQLAFGGEVERSTGCRDDDRVADEELGDDARDALQLLEVVEDQQNGRRPEQRVHIVVRRQAERLRDLGLDVRGLAERRERDEEGAAGERIG